MILQVVKDTNPDYTLSTIHVSLSCLSECAGKDHIPGCSHIECEAEVVKDRSRHPIAEKIVMTCMPEVRTKHCMNLVLRFTIRLTFPLAS